MVLKAKAKLASRQRPLVPQKPFWLNHNIPLFFLLNRKTELQGSQLHLFFWISSQTWAYFYLTLLSYNYRESTCSSRRGQFGLLVSRALLMSLASREPEAKGYCEMLFLCLGSCARSCCEDGGWCIENVPSCLRLCRWVCRGGRPWAHFFFKSHSVWEIVLTVKFLSPKHQGFSHFFRCFSFLFNLFMWQRTLCIKKKKKKKFHRRENYPCFGFKNFLLILFSGWGVVAAYVLRSKGSVVLVPSSYLYFIGMKLGHGRQAPLPPTCLNSLRNYSWDRLPQSFWRVSSPNAFKICFSTTDICGWLSFWTAVNSPRWLAFTKQGSKSTLLGRDFFFNDYIPWTYTFFLYFLMWNYNIIASLPLLFPFSKSFIDPSLLSFKFKASFFISYCYRNIYIFFP